MSAVQDTGHGRRHVFGQDQRKSGEAKTIVVIAIAGVMMVVEITTGLLFGSMALLADGATAEGYKNALSHMPHIVHTTFEIHQTVQQRESSDPSCENAGLR